MNVSVLKAPGIALVLGGVSWWQGPVWDGCFGGV